MMSSTWKVRDKATIINDTRHPHLKWNLVKKGSAPGGTGSIPSRRSRSANCSVESIKIGLVCSMCLQTREGIRAEVRAKRKAT